MAGKAKENLPEFKGMVDACHDRIQTMNERCVRVMENAEGEKSRPDH